MHKIKKRMVLLCVSMAFFIAIWEYLNSAGESDAISREVQIKNATEESNEPANALVQNNELMDVTEQNSERMDVPEENSETESLPETFPEPKTVLVEDIDASRISSTQIEINWMAAREASGVQNYLIKRCRLLKGKKSGEWETIAEVSPEQFDEKDKFSVIDQLSSSEPQQFAYRVDVAVSDEKLYTAGEGAEVLASNVMICIDPGHYANGTKITGEDSYNYIEGVFTLKIGLALKQILKEKYGIDSYMTRETGAITLGGYSDWDLDSSHIALRGEYAKEKDSDLFMSLHTNANNENANGYPTCQQPDEITKTVVIVNAVACFSQTALDAANSIGINLSKVNYLIGLSETSDFKKVNENNITDWTNEYNDSLDTIGTVCKREGSEGDYYGVLRGAAAVDVPGMIVEHGFHTVAKMRQMATDENLSQLWAEVDAYGIAYGFGFVADESIAIHEDEIEKGE